MTRIWLGALASALLAFTATSLAAPSDYISEQSQAAFEDARAQVRAVPGSVRARATAAARGPLLSKSAIAQASDVAVSSLPASIAPPSTLSSSDRTVSSQSNGLSLVTYQQRLDGRVVVGGQIKVLIDSSNAPAFTQGRFLSPRQLASPYSLSAAQALEVALPDVAGCPCSAGGSRRGADDRIMIEHISGGASLIHPASLWQVYFPTGDVLVPAWALTFEVASQGLADIQSFAYVVSAHDGKLLLRKNLQADASYRVFAESSPPFAPFDSALGNESIPVLDANPAYRTPRVSASSELISPIEGPTGRSDPWLSAPGTESLGNNVDAFLNLSAPDGYQAGSGDLRAASTSAPGVFDYPYTADTDPTTANARMAAVTQVFYQLNWLHDRWYEAGFDEVAGNAQASNYSRGGKEGDPIVAQVQDVNGRNNATMATPPDGGSPRMRLFLFDSPVGSRDPSVDFGVIAHEWAHYLSNRLVGDGFGLNTRQGGSLGEGWSDFVALLSTVRPTDLLVPNNVGFGGAYSIAPYITDATYFGLRRAPYSTDLAINGFTLRHVRTGEPLPATALQFDEAVSANDEVHNAGEIWAVALWEIYARLLTDGRHDFTTARSKMMSYLVLSLRMTPAYPTLLDARDALLAVAKATDAADYALMQNAFAKRGFGVAAEVPNRFATRISEVTESDVARAPWIKFQSIAVTQAPDDIDVDGDEVFDVGDTRTLRVTIRNDGNLPLVEPVSFRVELEGDAASSAQFDVENDGIISRDFSASPVPVGQTRDIEVGLSLRSATGIVTALATGHFDAPTRGPESAVFSSMAESALFFGNFNIAVNQRTSDDMAIGELSERDWRRSQTGTDKGWALDHRDRLGSGSLWHVDDHDGASVSNLESPLLTVGNSTLEVVFRHHYSFETAGPVSGVLTGFDGGVLDASIDGAPFEDVTVRGEFIQGGYNGQIIFGTSRVAGFVGDTGGALQLVRVSFPGLNPGQTVRLRWRQLTDEIVGAWGWDVDDVSVINAATPPFSAALAGDSTTPPDAPRAIAPDDLSVPERSAGSSTQSTVTLSGRAEGFPNPATLSYRWRQVGGPPVSTVGANFETLRFQIPRIAADTSYTFELTVSDDFNTGTDRVVVTALNVESPPLVADTSFATPERAPNSSTQATITLTGSATDDDGDALQYRWVQTSGPTVTLSSTTSQNPSFLAPRISRDTPFGFNLTVSDGKLTSTRAISVNLVNVESAPTLSDRTFTASERAADGTLSLITLEASAEDADGDPLTFEWTQTSGPQVALTEATTTRPSFRSPVITADVALTFSVTVSDGKARVSRLYSVNIRDVEVPPVVNVAPVIATELIDGTALPSRVTVVAEAFDPDGTPVTYRWTQLAGPAVLIEGQTTSRMEFTAPTIASDTTLIFSVEVADAVGVASAVGTVTIKNSERAPVVSLEPFSTEERALDQIEQATVTLRASATDPDGPDSALRYHWEQLSGPSVALSAVDVLAPSFAAPKVSGDLDLRFALTVSDGRNSTRREVIIRILNTDSPPVIEDTSFTAAGRNDTGALATITLSGAASDIDDDVLVFSWRQVEGVGVALELANTAAPTFIAPALTELSVLSFEVSVSDGVSTVSRVITVTLTPSAARVSANAGASRQVALGAIVELVGTGSSSIELPVTYQWSQVSGPAASLAGAATASAQFPADQAGVLVFEFQVRDSEGRDGTDQVTIQVGALEAEASRNGGGAFSLWTSMGMLCVCLLARRGSRRWA